MVITSTVDSIGPSLVVLVVLVGLVALFRHYHAR